MEAPWTLARPDLRFEFRPTFLEVASSPASMTAASRRLLRPRPKSTVDHSIKQVSSSPVSKGSSAASIARAAEVYRDQLKSRSVEKIHQLREVSAAMRGKQDEEKVKKKELRKLLSDVRRKCFFRLQQLNNPMRGHIMRALDQGFIMHLLQHYDGYSLSVDAILRLVGVFDGLSVPHTLRSDEILQTCGFVDNDVEEKNSNTASFRPPSPIQLQKGVGFRVVSPPDGKSDRTNRIREKNSFEMIPNTVVTAPVRRRQESYSGNHLMLDRGGSLGMNFAGSDFRDSPFMVPMKPYARNAQSTESQVEDSSMGFPTPLQRFQMEREMFMDSIDSRGGSMIVMQEKFSNRTNRVELSLHRKKDLRGLWRPKTLTKQSMRPFVATT